MRSGEDAIFGTRPRSVQQQGEPSLPRSSKKSASLLPSALACIRPLSVKQQHREASKRGRTPRLQLGMASPCSGASGHGTREQAESERAADWPVKSIHRKPRLNSSSENKSGRSVSGGAVFHFGRGTKQGASDCVSRPAGGRSLVQDAKPDRGARWQIQPRHRPKTKSTALRAVVAEFLTSPL
ncbi:hypothetical protein MRX96_013033 [Rhipicephalus microplus]